jgi:U3 small nucleolar RNA-associated protein 14
VLARGLQAADADVKQHYEEQIRLGEELTRKICGYESVNSDEAEAPPVENPVEKDPKLKKLFNMKFMRDAEEHRQEDLEDLKRQVGGPKSGIVTMVGCDREPPQVPAEPSPGAHKVEVASAPERPQKAELLPSPQKVEQPPKGEGEEENPWLQPSRKRTRRFVSANWFHQPTDQELAAAEERINLARREEQQEVLADAMGLSAEFAAEKEAAAMREAERGVDKMSDLHIEGWGAWTGPGVVESDGAKRRREHLEQERAKAVSEALRERKDSQMPHVVLRDGVDPAVEKYSIPEVPKMYRTPKQLQAQLAFSINPEVNSVGGFRRLIAPDIVTEPGTVIEPIFFTKMKKQRDKIEARNCARRPLEGPNKHYRRLQFPADCA